MVYTQPVQKLFHIIQNQVEQVVTQCYTVEPPYKGHFGNGSFVLSSEVVPISEVHHILIVYQHYNVYIG